MHVAMILQALTLFLLKYVGGNSDHVLPWGSTAVPVLCPSSWLKQGHAGPERVTPEADEGNKELYVNDVAMVTLTDRLLDGKHLLEISGGLTASTGQPTGLLQLGKDTVCTVYIKCDWSPDDQSFHQAPALDNSHIYCSIEKTLAGNGLYHLNVTVCSRFSPCSARLHIRAIPRWKHQPFSCCVPPTAAGMDQNRTCTMEDSVQPHIRSVRVYTEKQAYATGVNISFVAVTAEPDPLEFHWQFGDSVTVVTTSRRFIKSYALPDRYNVSVSVSNGHYCASSAVYRVVIQHVVQLTRLRYSPTALPNTAVQLICRGRPATDVTYLWDFGDGIQRFGQGIVHHVYNRTGEFVIKVTVSNLVSSASLQGHLFVVSEPCKPPPVKNMGPSLIQVWRYQPVQLSVTYEAPIQCRVSRGLLYSWSLCDRGGQPLHIPLTDTNRQYLHLPEYFLHYGTYKVLAKVQVAGSIVYSNYSVLLEVRPSPPVSTITGATHLFLSRHDSNAIITLDGRGSHDPDFPDNVMSYSWKCTAVNTAESLCFTEPVPTSFAVLAFPVNVLRTSCDLFKFTLTVHSGWRSASSDMFITVRSKPSRIIQMSCKECRGNSVNWNEQLAVTAACESCPGNITYSWQLYLVKASHRALAEVPFCSSVDIRSASDTGGTAFSSQRPGEAVPMSGSFLNDYLHTTTVSALSNEASISNDDVPDVKAVPRGTVRTESGRSGMHAAPPALQLPLAGEDVSPRTLSRWEVSVEHWGPSDLGSAPGSALDYEDLYSGIEEADPGDPLGRPTEPYDLDEAIRPSDVHQGDNVVGPNSLGRGEPEKTLLDLPRELIQPLVFESLTYTGTSSPVVTFKPSMLKPKSLYMLEVSASVLAESKQVLQGKAQLFLPTWAAPEGVACQVQPSTGLEMHTHFSIFCSTGQQDLIYEFSFSVGSSPSTRLYKGRNYQHYFSLPSGDPDSDYTVTIFIKIGNRLRALTRPCPVSITVLPSFQRTSSPHSTPEEELFVYGLGNLTNLMQTRNDRDIINYISLLTGVLNRLSQDPQSSAQLQKHTRAALISAGCHVTITSQDLLLDVLHAISDLMKVSNQVTFGSAKLIMERTRDIQDIYLRESSLPYRVLDAKVVNALVHVLSCVLDVPALSSTLGIQLTRDALHITSDVVLMYMQSSKDSEYSVNSTFMKLMAWHCSSFPTPVKTINGTTFYIPNTLETDINRGSSDNEQAPCFITRLVSYKQNPFHWQRAPKQLVGGVVDIKVFNCTTRREVQMKGLSAPVVIEFQKRERSIKRGVSFTLMQREVNTHQFDITPELLHKALQVTVEFRRPSSRIFPVLMLFRIHKRPTPTLYNIQEVYRWKGQAAQIFLPPLSLKDAGTGYLMILNADFNKSSRNRYISKAVNYTLSIQAIECLAWDGLREWRPNDCSVLPGLTWTKINCSCGHLSSFTVSHWTIPSTYSAENVTEYTSVSACLTPCVMAAVCTALYAVMLVFGKDADGRMEQNSSPLLLPDNKPSDHFLYAITTDTGLRSAASMTAKVYIVLYGENGLSQTRELSSPDHKLFTRNSRNTFILSAPQSLGRVWQVHLWHDNGGASPSWFLSHVVVKDIVEGRSWLFPGQCWLAVDEGDGRVERRLQEQELPFREALTWNLTECLEDFHPWLSAYSRPSYSTHTHVQRLSVCFLLLQAYMCANAVLVHFHEEQYSSELGLIDVSPVSMTTGLCGLALLPLGSLVSCLFRISKTNKKLWSGDQYKSQLPCVCSVRDPHHASVRWPGESEIMCLSTQNSLWMQHTLTKKCEQSVPDWMTPGFVSCTQQADSSTLHRSAESSSAIEVIEENVPNGSDKLQGRRFTCSSFDFQSGLAVNAFSSTHDSSRKCSTLLVWCYSVAWALWLFLSLTCIVVTGTLGLKFSSTKSLLWIQSVFFSLFFCVFAVHPAMAFIFAVSVSLWSQKQGYFIQCSTASESTVEQLKHHRPSEACFCFISCQQPEVINKHFEKVLAARQRARHLRLVHPPTSAELKSVRHQFKRRTLLRKTIRKLVLHMVALSVVSFVVYGKSSSDHFHVNQALRTPFTWASHSPFNLIHKLDTWWNCTVRTLDGLYLCPPYSDGTEDRAKPLRGAFCLIGEPVITKMEHIHILSQGDTVCSPAQGLMCPELDRAGFPVSSRSHLCGKLGCYKGPGIIARLGKNRSEAFGVLKELWATGWTGRHSHAVAIQFTLYSPLYGLFSTVTVLGERTHPGRLVSSSFIHAARLGHAATPLSYWLVATELLFLFLTLLHASFLTYVIAQRGWPYWTDIQNLLEVVILLVSLISFICTVHHFTLKEDMIENLQRDNYKTFVDLSLLSFWEQFTRVICGVLLFLLLIKFCLLLRIHESVDSAASAMTFIFPNMLWSLIAGVILLIAFSCLGNLLFHSQPSVFSTLSRSVYFSIAHSCGVGKLRDLEQPHHRSQVSLALCCFGALLCVVSVAGRALVTGAIGLTVKTTTKCKRRNPHLSVSDLVCYIRDMGLALTGKTRLKRSENYAHTNSLILEEFEDLLDELLLRLSSVSDNQEPQNLPYTERHCSPEVAIFSAADLNKTVPMMKKNDPCVTGVSSCPPEDCIVRSRLEWKTLQRFQRTIEMIRAEACSSSHEVLRNGTSAPANTSTHSQTSLCSSRTISVQIECGNMLSISRSQNLNLVRQDECPR